MSAPRLLAALLAAALGSAAAADEFEGGFWGGIDAGAAALSRSYSITARTRDTEFAMAFRGGYAWHPRLLLGVELGGWTLQASTYQFPADEDPEGEGIQTLYGIAQFYPSAAAPFFLKAGLGHVKYWNNRPREDGASGAGVVLGAGYDLSLGSRWYVTPAVELARGKFDGATSPAGVTQDQRYRALTLRLGITYR